MPKHHSTHNSTISSEVNLSCLKTHILNKICLIPNKTYVINE